MKLPNGCGGVAQYAKYTGRAFTAIEIGPVLWKTGEAYREGGDWQKELFEGMAEWSGAAFGGWLVMFVFTGAGWWVIIPAYGGAFFASVGFKWLVQQIEER